MAFDLMKWLTKDMGFSEDEAKTLAPQFTEARVATLAKGYTNADEYQRFRSELQTTSDQLTSEMTEWAAMKQRGEEADTQRLARIETLEADKARLSTRLSEVAVRAGIDPKKALEGIVDPAPAPTPVPVPVDPTKFVARDEFGTLVGYLYNNPAELMAIQADHRSLFGRDMTGDEIRALSHGVQARVAQKKAIEPRALWEETFAVPAQREKVRQDKYDADMRAAEDRGAERVRSEQALPTSHPIGSHAPIFKREGNGESKLQRPSGGPARSILSTAEALRSGKYRHPQPAGAGR
jgi:hypothetical protein